MSWLNKLERNFGGVAVPNLTLSLIVGQVAAYLFINMGVIAAADLVFVPRLVAQGEVWRVISFLFLPPVAHPIFLIFAWYLFYIMGSALESHWGDFRYNVYILIAWAASIATSFIAFNQAATNAYIAGSVFLAFAWLNPEFVLYLFFVLPVKIKWLAWLTWAGYVFQLVVGTMSDRMLVIAAVLNFLIFFGPELMGYARTNRRQMVEKAGSFARAGKAEPFHTCHTCGKTDVSHPDMPFYYCSECTGAPGYCAEHIDDHEHV